MSKLPNHYETLNVANTASQEEIRASYISLCKMFHTEAIMLEELSKSYAVLKDENTRTVYDLRLSMEMNKRNIQIPPLPVQVQVQQLQKQQPVMEDIPAIPELPEEVQIEEKNNIAELLEQKRRERELDKKRDSNAGSRIAAAIAIVALLGAMVFGIATSDTVSRLGMIDVMEMIKGSDYLRPATAPNGQPFPETTGYINGYEVRNNQGSTSLNVNNSKNDNDVYLKLLSLEGNKLITVRHVYIKGKTDFKLENLTVGTYEIQYLDLVAGVAGKSETFTVTDNKNMLGTSSTTLSVTLKTAVDGQLKVENVPVGEFNSLASL